MSIKSNIILSRKKNLDTNILAKNVQVDINKRNGLNFKASNMKKINADFHIKHEFRSRSIQSMRRSGKIIHNENSDKDYMSSNKNYITQQWKFLKKNGKEAQKYNILGKKQEGSKEDLIEEGNADLRSYPLSNSKRPDNNMSNIIRNPNQLILFDNIGYPSKVTLETQNPFRNFRNSSRDFLRNSDSNFFFSL